MDDDVTLRGPSLFLRTGLLPRRRHRLPDTADHAVHDLDLTAFVG
jgi:hypothetical protein